MGQSSGWGGSVKARRSNSLNHFIDTNVILRHANGVSQEFASDINTIFEEATGLAPARRLWVSSVIFSELRPSHFHAGVFKSVNELAEYIQAIATIVSPTPDEMLRAARLRDKRWMRINHLANERPRSMTLGDAIHLVSALWVKEVDKVQDLEFLTFDDSSGASIEADQGTKALPILSLEDYTYNMSGDPDVRAVVDLPRIWPVLKAGGQVTLAV